MVSQLLPDSEKALACELSIFDSRSNWEGGILLLRISNAASGGTYGTGFLTQCMALVGCQGFDVVSAFRVFLIKAKKKKGKKKKPLACLSFLPLITGDNHLGYVKYRFIEYLVLILL